MKVYFLPLFLLLIVLVKTNISVAQSSLTSDYFRSRTTGNWNIASNWESSTDGAANWITATITPTFAANTITIRNGHTITINTNITADQVIIANGGILELATTSATSLTVNDGTGNDIIIQSGGIFKHNITGSASPLPSFSANSIMEIQGGGILEVNNNNGAPSNYAVTTSPIASHIAWNDNSIFNWKSTSNPMAGVTYFPANSAIPVFRFSSVAAIGGTAATTINGLLEANATVSFQSTGTKTIRNGIIGTDTVVATSVSVGQFIINGSTAKLGGGVLVLPNLGLLISAGTDITLLSNKTINKVSTSASNISPVNLSGNLIASDYIIDGNSTIQINGTVKTTNANGLSGGTNTTFANNFTINSFGGSSTVEYYRLGDQNVTPLYYANLNISGTGTKKIVTSADLSLSGSLDIASYNNFALNGTNNLNLGNSSVLTINTNATLDDGGESKIKGGSSINIYGTLITRAAAGFTGSTFSTIPGTTNTVIVAIYAGSTIEYGRAGDQVVSSRNDYSNLTFSNSGTKTLPTTAPNGTVTIKDNAIVDALNKTFGDVNTNLTMLGGRFRVAGLATKPDIAGTYNLTGGVIEFTGGSSSSRQNILSTPVYLNIEVTGVNVGNSNSSTKLLNGGSFVVKTGGSYENSGDKIDGTTGIQSFVMEAGSTFKTGVTGGLSGSATAALYNIENITIDPKSTIVYSRLGDQTITPLSAGYPTLLFKGSGIKNLTSGSLLVAATADSVTIDPLVTFKVSTGAVANFNNRPAIVHSSSTGTGIIGEITDGAIALINATNVTVERFIPARRAFRFLSVPVNTANSIRTSWMENQNNPAPAYSVNNNSNPGYGTHITGSSNPADGFDATATNNPSLFTFNNSSQAWQAVTNTNVNLNAESCYRILVRGSRSVDLSNNAATPSSTILRSNGSVRAGSFFLSQTTNPSINGTLNYYSLVANPYASPVNWDALQKPGLSSYYTVWDPNLNTRGAYATYGNGITNPSSSSINQNIQSGQSFFVQTKAANPSLTFNETNKTSINRNVFRTTNNVTSLAIQLLTDTTGNTNNTADGVNIFFDESFSNSIAAEDAAKLSNLDENMAINRNGISLSIEGRAQITSIDTISLQINQYRQSNYYLSFNANNLADGITGVVQDKYLKNETAINFLTTTLLPFSVTNDSASFAQDRFTIILKPTFTLPITISGLKAFKKDAGIQVQWNADIETGIKHYEVEKSSDGHQFTKAAIIAVHSPNSLTESYDWYDNNINTGSNFYRIKCIEKLGSFKYSNVAHLTINLPANQLFVYPNPVKENTINLTMTNVENSIYTFAIYNNEGQKIYAGTINHHSTAATYKIMTGKVMSKGIYKLKISNATKTLTTNIIKD